MAWREVWSTAHVIVSLSAPSCKAAVYARCQLKTMGTGAERPLPDRLWAVTAPTLGNLPYISVCL